MLYPGSLILKVGFENVFKVVKESLKFNFDGYLIETHHQPEKALTDAQQQLDFKQLNAILKLIRSKNQKE